MFHYLATQCINDVRAVTRETIRSYLLWLSRQDYSPWTISTHWQGIRRFFAWLEKTDAVLLDPARISCGLPQNVRKYVFILFLVGKVYIGHEMG